MFERLLARSAARWSAYATVMVLVAAPVTLTAQRGRGMGAPQYDKTKETTVTRDD